MRADFKSHCSISMAAIPSFGRRRNFQKTFVEFQLVNNDMNRKSKACVLMLIGDSGLGIGRRDRKETLKKS